ncbi:MAG: FAD-dependent oxidoreductase [Gemmatimonadetes bacterium]|nr:FAD-dependent oxidoreductase [Gemmatimonadota bacterium]
MGAAGPVTRLELDRREFLKLLGLEAGALALGGCATGRVLGGPGRPAPEVVVVGAGAWGGWTALHLRQMGAAVTLVDTWGPGNSRSTSGDETRGVRSSYGDRPEPFRELWTRWAAEAIARWEVWDETWRRSWDHRLFTRTGDLILRGEWEPYLTDTRQVWDALGVGYDVLDVDEVAYRWPQIRLDGFAVALYERRAGVARSRSACLTVAEAFRRLGGRVVIARAQPGCRAGSRLEDLELSSGDRLRARHFVFACGPWLGKLFPDLLAERLRTPIGHVYYFATPPGDARFTHPNLPSFNFPGVTGWPALSHDSRGFRVRTGGRPPMDPDLSDRWIDASFFEQPRKVLAERFPELKDAPLLETRACHYELSVSRNFMIDRHPELENVWIAGGGSAEGFKFGPVVGEYLARRVLGRDREPGLAALFRIPEETFPPTAAQGTDG